MDSFLEKTALNTKYVKVGSFVRLPLIKTQFGKEGQTYTKAIYEVVEISASKIWVRNIENGNELKRSYNVNQVQVVKPPKSVSPISDTDQINQAKSVVGIPATDQIDRAKTNMGIPIMDQIDQAKKQAAIERKIKRMGLEPNYSTEDRKTRRGK